MQHLFSNILLCSADDHSRVVLTQLDNKSGRDYINASFIDVSNN